MQNLINFFVDKSNIEHGPSTIMVVINWFFTVLSFIGALLIGIYTIPNVHRTLKTKSASHINTAVASIMMCACFCLATSTIWIVGVTLFTKFNGWNPVTGENVTNLELTIENMWFPLAMMVADTISFVGNLILLVFKLISVKKEKENKKTILNDQLKTQTQEISTINKEITNSAINNNIEHTIDFIDDN